MFTVEKYGLRASEGIPLSHSYPSARGLKAWTGLGQRPSKRPKGGGAAS